MKTIATIFFILFIGTAASAQENTDLVKIETITTGIVTQTQQPTIKTEKTQEVARLYKFKGSRIKKELSFATKRNSPKMA
ncbi:hypothetical protein [Maribacter cobaltidurans]|uniref:Uncharacterized protein n=1 Tax=Maribacter cobaltidurans TaxID=1178778 RepID=A0A223V147_9FLAO|nr:hypothetical protein [Maribacter cobaltidurans]ASV29044.1 hypothetical protein CJ263_01725 [Maribacter cobaltidurans]GGD72388.1 hypothetical protein GCM10011412_07510 [Maribacter cobaltidurans]